VQEYIDQVILGYWGYEAKDSDIQFKDEMAGEESEEFLNFFD
jgi:hypothetical protein